MLLSADALTRRPFFESVSLALSPGELVVLRGPTGSGKTLFLRALADLDPVDSGSVRLADRDRRSYSPAEWRRRVLYVRQRFAPLGETVADDLATIANLSGTPTPSALPSSRLDPSRAVTELSGGESQWLALERALLAQPDVLLLDEASSALDPDSAAEFEARVRAFARDSRAALWVSHDVTLAGRLDAREVTFA